MIVVADRALVDRSRIVVTAEISGDLRSAAVRRFVGTSGAGSGEEVLVTERHWVNVPHFDLISASMLSSASREDPVVLISWKMSRAISKAGVANGAIALQYCEKWRAQSRLRVAGICMG